MKNLVKLLLCSLLLFTACDENEVEIERTTDNTADVPIAAEEEVDEEINVDAMATLASKVYNVVDADRCPFPPDQQPMANLWWPKNDKDFYNPEAYFSSTENHKMIFTEYEDGTARLEGSTVMGTCVVDVDVWFKDRTSWSDWEAAGGEFKREGCAGDAAKEEEMNFYMIDSEKSTFSANGGDCLGEGNFTLEQRPDPTDPNEPDFGAHIGPNGANFDSNLGEYGLSTWAWIVNNEGERMWVMDFNFLLDESACTVVDADRCPFPADQQPASNMWWPGTEEDYYNPKTYFSSTPDNPMTFAEYNNGTARLQGTTVMGTCTVEIDVWFKDRASWTNWEASGGEFKREGCAGDVANEEDMNFYMIDSEKSTFVATGGDCLGEGKFTLEQRPDPSDPNMPDFGAHIGPGGANFDSEIGANGMSTWAYIVNSEGERMWIMDSNFKMDCPPPICGITPL